MLQALGVDNYGINNVVGGIVAMSSLLTGAVTSTITRFITYALGEGDKQRMKLVFSTSVNVMIALSILAVVFLEVIGVWFLMTQADIPEGRMEAAHWALQCSIISLVFSLISQPYNATIVAHEHMSIYAYMSIVDVTLKLAVCYIISCYGGDRLILLSLLGVAISLGMCLFYSWYCSRHFYEAHYDYRLFDKTFIKEMSKFTSWYLAGNVVWVLNTNGMNMLINVFFGVAINAARGVAMSVTSAINSFVTNFTMAFVPQITKSYASGDRDRLLTLVFHGTKFVWFLMFVFIIPVFCEADTLLKIWLGEPPAYASVFLRFALIESWSMLFNFALHHTILATGKVKKVNICISLYSSLIFPLTWLAFKFGFPVWFAYVIFILFNTTSKGFMLLVLNENIGFPVKTFLKKCITPCLVVTMFAFTLPGLMIFFLPQSYTRFIIVVPIAIIWTLLCEYYIGLNKNEKSWVVAYANKVIKIIKK